MEGIGVLHQWDRQDSRFATSLQDEGLQRGRNSLDGLDGVIEQLRVGVPQLLMVGFLNIRCTNLSAQNVQTTSCATQRSQNPIMT